MLGVDNAEGRGQKVGDTLKASTSNRSLTSSLRHPTSYLFHQPIAQSFRHGFGFGMDLQLVVDASHVE